jgi:hypothetical protein
MAGVMSAQIHIAGCVMDALATLQCSLVAKPPRRRGRQRDCWYLYDVTFGGELIVADSADPETDLARALIARGITGVVEIIDGRTGKRRSRVNIEAASRVTFREDRKRGPHRQAWHPFASESACVSAMGAEVVGGVDGYAPAGQKRPYAGTVNGVAHNQGRNHPPFARWRFATDFSGSLRSHSA